MESKKYIEENLDLILADLKKLISYNSVFSTDEKPFGKQNRLVLDCFLSMMDDIGLKTKNLDYYCGFGEIGQGDKLVGIVGHLDVVPAGEGWNSNPFEMVEKNGYVYGRGVSDDKGGVVANYWALKYLIEQGYQFKKRFRLIVGCNEESGFECIKHYVSKEGHIDAGYTPDAEWPGIYGEKGIFRCDSFKKKDAILNIKGGQAQNAVANFVEIEVAKDSLDLEIFKEYLNKNGLTFKISEVDDHLLLRVEGVAAHASMPWLGKNAISYGLKALYEANFKDSFVESYNKLIGVGYYGENARVDFKDEYGPLTFNVGLISVVNDEIKFTIDIRYPVTNNNETILNAMKNAFEKDFRLEDISMSAPLFIDPESKMVKALKKAYQDVTNDFESKMVVIGGGTYAKGIKNCIAFGPANLDEDNHIHDVNEELSIEQFKKNIEIYIEAIKNLNEMEL